MSSTADIRSLPALQAWVLAARPRTLTAALVPVVAGTVLAGVEGYDLAGWVFWCTLFAAVAIQIGTNLVNDLIDFKKGADTGARVGPVRVTQQGLLSPAQVARGAVIAFGVALLLGVPLVWQGGAPILIIGLLSIMFGYAYTGGPFPLAYRGLGEPFVILFFGVLAVSGTHLLQSGELSPMATVAGLQTGLLATVLLVINNYRDAPQDGQVGKRTLAVRFGLRFARAEVVVCVLLPFLLSAVWVGAGWYGAGLTPLVLLPLALGLSRRAIETAPGAACNPLLGRAAALHLLFGICLALGLLLDGGSGERAVSPEPGEELRSVQWQA